ncbi:uncharacterized protein K02A2.6-like [Bombus bifarius]|uniref:Uncharacterized protein K02A2.6-like n=1 Tax=Bombus bifarius TaxID=103933 RepID=A0A6P8M6L8_9HYME|nr:uncharacterized protein K02A2.6-like [Bombus bifarius]
MVANDGRTMVDNINFTRARDGSRIDDSEEDDDDDEISVVGDRLDVNGAGNRNLNSKDDGVRVTPVLRRSRQDEPRCMLLKFTDVEDSLEKFSGDGLPSVSRWIEDFEEMAKVCGWSDIHMVAFAKKLFTGSAQSVVKRGRCTKSWIKLRESLKDEFEDAVRDQQIHQKLANRMKRPDKSLQQYMNSIPDEVANKAVLYGAKTMQQLKERLKQYEAMRRDMKAKTKFEGRKEDKGKRSEVRSQPRPTASDKRRCFSCGSADHLSAKCPEKGKGMKCFKCNEFGHVAANCTARQVKTYIISRPERKKYLKDVSIDGCKFVSLVDTGSDLTFIRSDKSARLGSPPLGNYKLRFDGFGSDGNSTWSEFTKVMTRHSLLLGTDFLDQVELRVKRGEVTFLRLNGQTDGHEDAPDVLRVNAIEQTDEIDLSHVREPHYREAIRDIIKGLAPSERKEVDDLMEAWTNESVIKPSDSEYASPIVVVRKKDGSIRVCVDFRELNELIECPHFPLPLIEDVLDTLQGAQLFTTIDLKNGFFHVSLDKDSQKYTSFVTPTGQYEFLKLPFGLKISPIVFQKYISKIYKELMDKGIVIVYMDDIIIHAQNLEEAWERLQMVVELTGQYGLVINWKKCRFMQREMEYLGHIVSGNTIKPSAHKTKAVANFPKPTSVRKVQSFLGLTGYFRKFIRDYAKIAKPLTDLLKKEIDFRFGDRESEAFETLKAALTSGPVLTLYRIGAETELHTDAPAEGYGAILMQLGLNDGKFHPVYFASGKTTSAEAKYTSYELEVLAIVKALKRFRQRPYDSLIPDNIEEREVDIPDVRQRAIEDIEISARYDKGGVDKTKAKVVRGPFEIAEILEGDRYTVKTLDDKQSYKDGHDRLREMLESCAPAEMDVCGDDNDGDNNDACALTSEDH